MNILAAAFCIILFSLTVPFTRIAAMEAPPEFLILTRLLGASLICLIVALIDGWLPPRKAWIGLISTALGSVLGFSSLTAFAMREVPSGHAAVALAAMPIATAAYSVLRDGTKPGNKFWIYAIAGTLLSFGFFFSMSINKLLLGDLLLILAVFSAALGYVEGGRLSRSYGGKRVMTWAILCTLPVTLTFALFYLPGSKVVLSEWSSSAWISMGYLALISQSTGMFLWFKVLAKGPMEKMALVQLMQPFLTLLASILLLGEHVLWPTWIIAACVAICILGANKEKASV